MSQELADQLPDEVRFHCQICNKLTTRTAEELDQYVKDDVQWPHCCGARMSVILGTGPAKSPQRSNR